MGDQDARVVWVLLGAVLLVTLLGSATRWVTRGQVLVVIRRGVTHRTHGPGPALLVPLVERSELLVTMPEELLVAVRAATVDGGDVRVLATAQVSTAAPPVGTAYVDPVRVARSAVEEILRAEVRQQLTDDLPVTLPARLDGVRDQADTIAQSAGGRVEALAIDEIEVLYLARVDHRGSG